LHRLRLLVVLAVSLTAALVITACGGDSGGDEDPTEVLTATFNNDQTVTSGNLDLSFKLDAEGGDDPGSFEASLNGPFQGGDSGSFPKFDFNADVNLDSSSQDFSGSAGLASTGDQGFVNFQDQEYSIPANIFSQFADAYTQAAQQGQDQQDKNQNLLSSLGIDPTNWLTDLQNEGNDDVDGTDTIHISGQANVPDLVADLKKIVQQVPQASDRVTPAQLAQFDQLSSLIKSADFDIYTGADDDILRKLDASLEVDPPATGGSPDSVKVEFSIGFSDVNQPQTISAPTGAQPLSTLLQQFGVDESQLGALGAAIDQGASAGAGSGSGSTGSGGGGSDASQAYLECLGKAQGADAIQQCQALLQ